VYRLENNTMAEVGIGKGTYASILCSDCDTLIPKGTLQANVHECEKCGEPLCDRCANFCSACGFYYCLRHYDFDKSMCENCSNITEVNNA